MAGDLRSLYLGWLDGNQDRDEDDDTPEPPLPPGLRQLTAPLKALAEFLRLDPDLIDAAAQADQGVAPTGPSAQEQAVWVAALAEAEKNDLVLQLMQGQANYLGLDLQRRFREEGRRRQKSTPGGAPGAKRRTVAQLLAAHKTVAEENQRGAAKKAARDKARREAKEAADRAKYLDALAPREAEVWSEAEGLLATKRPKDYDRAVELLKDLRDLAERTGRKDEVTDRLRQLRGRHTSKSSLMKRWNKAGLPT